MKLKLAVWCGLFTIGSAGCCTTAQAAGKPKPQLPPRDFSVDYEWRAGTMPPPYHYEYSVHIGPGTKGEMILVPDYPGDKVPVWTEAFTLKPEAVTKLYQLMVKRSVFTRTWHEQTRPPIGGS